MIFEWMSDPSAWVGLLTLVVLEIVLGIDNLVFIAILAEKLPPEQRNTARVVGLILALLMRLVLLASIAWVVTLTEPLFHIFDHPFSGRDLILLFGGVFLLFKGTMELHERIDAKVVQKEESPANAVFWMVIVQIVVLDAVFSLDSVITAVGMVKHLSVMMIAVIIAVGIMLWACCECWAVKVVIMPLSLKMYWQLAPMRMKCLILKMGSIIVSWCKGYWVCPSVLSSP